MDFSLELDAGGGDAQCVRGRMTYFAGHPGFDGHFPGDPILPAFLHVQAALDLLHAAGLRVELARVESAKFLRPVRPKETIAIALTFSGPESYDAVLRCAGEECSRFSLVTRQTQDSPPLRR
jgi:3-hydroxymyristoyl/3-hydroxydecanoyl-(acyl carrier protein) dehydratase